MKKINPRNYLFFEKISEKIIHLTEPFPHNPHFCLRNTCLKAIYKSVLQPRHTWLHPIWVLTTGEKLYIAQAASLEDAVAMVRTQYPEVV